MHASLARAGREAGRKARWGRGGRKQGQPAHSNIIIIINFAVLCTQYSEHCTLYYGVPVLLLPLVFQLALARATRPPAPTIAEYSVALKWSLPLLPSTLSYSSLLGGQQVIYLLVLLKLIPWWLPLRSTP